MYSDEIRDQLNMSFDKSDSVLSVFRNLSYSDDPSLPLVNDNGDGEEDEILISKEG